MIRITNSKWALQIGRRAAALQVFRAAVCLLVVCCLLFNISPIRAQAVLIADDLVLLGIIMAGVLLVGGVALNQPTQDDFRMIGESWQEWSYRAARTKEDQMTIVAINQDLIEQARQAMNNGKPPIIPLDNFDFWINLAILEWIRSYINGETVFRSPIQDYDGNFLPTNGQSYTAGTVVNMPRQKTTNAVNGFSVDNSDYVLYRVWSRSKNAVGFVTSYRYYIFAPGEIDFSVTVFGTAKLYQYTNNNDDHILVDGEVYTWAFVDVSLSATSLPVCWTSAIPGCYVCQDSVQGIAYNKELDPYDGRLAAALIGGTVIAQTSNMTEKGPDAITGGIKDFIEGGGQLSDIVLPEIDYSGIMGDGISLQDAISQNMTGVADGSQTWQDYVDSVTPSGDVTTQEGNVITGSGVSGSPSLWNLLQRLGNYILNGFNDFFFNVGRLCDFFTGTTMVESPLTALNFGKLFDLFPFSIPAGIYETIKFWGTPAAAPVLSFPVPNMEGGKFIVDTYDIKLSDIPGMDRCAAIIRAGELILFAIGLALVTRKVTKW